MDYEAAHFEGNEQRGDDFYVPSDYEESTTYDSVVPDDDDDGLSDIPKMLRCRTHYPTGL